jgi:nucleoid DNA-binding protein
VIFVGDIVHAALFHCCSSFESFFVNSFSSFIICLFNCGPVWRSTTRQALKEKKEVAISGFGKFRTSVQKARVARNPNNGTKVNVPEKQRVLFSAYTNLKMAVNDSTKSSSPAKK